MTPYYYTHRGRRDYQEDMAFIGDDYFLVADGMGGHTRGDIASLTVSEAIHEFIKENPATSIVAQDQAEMWGSELIKYALANLDSAAMNDDTLVGMGTTIALVVQINAGLIIIHVGDSRVYVLSPSSELLHRTRDHSWVAEAVTAGLITEEEAIGHPKSNVVTRALVVANERRTSPAVSFLSDVQSGSRIFMCTDGVLEAWTSDEALLGVLTSDEKLDIILSRIQRHAEAEASDNNTAILVEYRGVIHSVSQLHSEGLNEIDITPVDDADSFDHKEHEIGALFPLVETGDEMYTDNPSATPSVLGKNRFLIHSAFIIIFLGGLIYIFHQLFC